MRRAAFAAIVAVVAVTIGVRADEARWWSHVEALANDGMEGRNTGSPAHKRAAEYVAGAFQEVGLEPAGIGGYIQPVAFKTRKIDEVEVEPGPGHERHERSAGARRGRRTSACASIPRRPSTRRSSSSATA